MSEIPHRCFTLLYCVNYTKTISKVFLRTKNEVLKLEWWTIHGKNNQSYIAGCLGKLLGFSWMYFLPFETKLIFLRIVMNMLWIQPIVLCASSMLIEYMKYDAIQITCYMELALYVHNKKFTKREWGEKVDLLRG